jgi:hypothetical protein
MTIIISTKRPGAYQGVVTSTTTKKVMRRVYMVWLVRTITEPISRTLLAAIFIIEIFVDVSIRDVYTNARTVHTVGNGLDFASSAFLNTNPLVQLSLVGATLVFFSFSKDITQGVSRNLPSPFRVTRGIRLWSKA